MKNSAAPLALLAALPPEQLLGANLACTVAGDLAIPEADIEAAFAAAGLRRSVGPMTPLARFQERLGNGGKKVTGRRGEDRHREIVGVECRHADNDLIAYEFNLNLPSQKQEEANLQKVGTVTMRKSTGEIGVRLHGCDLQGSRGEDEYLDAAESAGAAGVLRRDRLDFLRWANEGTADITRFAGGDHYGGSTIKRLVSEVLDHSAGSFPLGARGGFYFVLRDGSERCAYARAMALITALEKATNGGCRFTYFPVPAVQEAVTAATEIVRVCFMQEIGKIEREVAEMELKRSNQHDGRETALNEILEKLDGYEALWGLAGRDIKAAAQKAQDMLNGAKDGLKVATAAAATAAKSAKAAAAKAAKAAKVAAGPEAGPEAGDPWAEVEDGLATDDRAEVSLGEIEVVIEADPFFGLTYKVTRNGSLLASGAGDTLAEVRTQVAALA